MIPQPICIWHDNRFKSRRWRKEDGETFRRSRKQLSKQLSTKQSKVYSSFHYSLKSVASLLIRSEHRR